MLEEKDVKHSKNLIKILISETIKFEMNGVEAFGLGTALNWLLSMENRYNKQQEVEAEKMAYKKKKKVTKKKTKKVAKKKVTKSE
jgi:hypothetical protein